MKNQQWGVVLAAIMICVTIVIGLGKLQRTGITIEDNRQQRPEREKGPVNPVPKSISVSGEGKIMVVPDHVRIAAGVSELADTTKKAQDQTNRKLARVMEILKENSISERNIQTSNLIFRPEYDWSDGERKLIGQRVEQTLTLSIPEIDSQPERVSRILDALGAIDRLEMNSVSFAVKNKKELVSRARILAFEEAREKAESLAQLAGLALDKPLQIAEEVDQDRPTPYFRATPQMDMAAGTAAPSLPAGELDVTVTVKVAFGVR